MTLSFDRRPALVRIEKQLGLLLTGALVVACLPAAAVGPPVRGKAVTHLRLELRPWTTPQAVALRLDLEGNAERWLFVPTMLGVESVHRSVLQPDEAAALLDIPSLDESPPTAAAEEGDLLTIELALVDGSARRIRTFRHRLAREAETWLDTLLAASAGWPEAERAAAYLRAEPISDDRMAAMGRRGLIDPLSFDELPAIARPAARSAMASPFDFVAVDPALHEALRPLAQHGAELVVVWQGRGFTLTPYRRREAPG